MIRQKKLPDYVIGQNYVLKGKVRCGNCRRCLYYEATTYKEYFLCRHGKQLKKHSECCTEEYSVKHVDTVVWNALKELLSTLEWLGVKAGAKAKEQMKAVKVSQKAIDSEIEKLKAEKIRQYELYADGAITKEQYLRKKKELSDKMEKLETDRKEQAEEFDLQSELWESASNLNSMTKQFSGEQKLTRKMVMAFIENVYIYDPKRIEIVFQHEDEIARLVESLKDDENQAADTLK